jgi:hypothetical protein
MKKFKLVAIFMALALSSGNSMSQEGNYVKLDKELKAVYSKNNNIKSIMSLYDFIEEVPSSYNIYSLDKERGKRFVPQESSALALYDKYIEMGYLPVIAIVQTNKDFIEIYKEASK